MLINYFNIVYLANLYIVFIRNIDLHTNFRREYILYLSC